MRLVIVYENFNLTFTSPNAELVEEAIFRAEARGAEGCQFEVTETDSGRVVKKRYWFNTKNYLYRICEESDI